MPDREATLPDQSDTSVIDTEIFHQRRAQRRQKLETYGAENRDDLTQAEIAMAAILTDLGWRFTTEHPKYRYIFDFYVPAYKLVIEVDGGYHNEPKQKMRDKRRDRFLVSRGLTVLRFTNEQVIEFPRKTRATLLNTVNPGLHDKILSCVIPSDADCSAILHTVEDKYLRAAFSFKFP